MKEAICYYYGFRNIEIKKVNYITEFTFNGDYYAFVPFDRNPKEIDDLLSITIELRKNGFKCHQIIMNRFKNAITNINSKLFVLLFLDGDLTRKIDIFDIVSNSEKLLVNSRRKDNYNHNWGQLWERKIDYLESQIKAFGNSNHKLLYNFSYYIGMAENAILYYKNIDSGYNNNLVLSHRRVFFPNIWLNYANPLSFIFDVPVRDYAEYIKSCFFYDSVESAYNNFNVLLKIKKFDKKTLELFLARMLFPSYYFDEFEKITLNKEDEEKIIIIIDKTGDYEKFIKYCVDIIKSQVEINEFPNWIL